MNKLHECIVCGNECYGEEDMVIRNTHYCFGEEFNSKDVKQMFHLGSDHKKYICTGCCNNTFEYLKKFSNKVRFIQNLKSHVQSLCQVLYDPMDNLTDGLSNPVLYSCLGLHRYENRAFDTDLRYRDYYYKVIRFKTKGIHRVSKMLYCQVVDNLLDLTFLALNDEVIIRIAKERGRFTQKELSSILNVSISSVNNICKGKPHKQEFKNLKDTSRMILKQVRWV